MEDEMMNGEIRATERITITVSRKVGRRVAEMANRCRCTRSEMGATLVRSAVESEFAELFMGLMFDIEFHHMSPTERQACVERWHNLPNR